MRRARANEEICRVHARMHGEQFATWHVILEDTQEGEWARGEEAADGAPSSEDLR